MRSLTARELIKVLRAHGFALMRQHGSHMIFKNRDGIMVPVPLHSGAKRIPVGTFLAIVKQSRIPKEKFRK